MSASLQNFRSFLAGLVTQGAAFTAGGAVPRRIGNAHQSIAPYELLRCADGGLVQRWEEMPVTVEGPASGPFTASLRPRHTKRPGGRAPVSPPGYPLPSSRRGPFPRDRG